MCAEALMRIRLSGCEKLVFIEKTFGNITKSPTNRSERYERRCQKKENKDK